MREELVKTNTTAELVETKQNSLVSLYRCIDRRQEKEPIVNLLSGAVIQLMTMQILDLFYLRNDRSVRSALFFNNIIQLKHLSNKKYILRFFENLRML